MLKALKNLTVHVLVPEPIGTCLLEEEKASGIRREAIIRESLRKRYKLVEESSLG